MTTRIIKIVIVLTFGLFAFSLIAAGPPGPPGGGGGSDPPCWPPPCVPIDGGISALISAGVALGLYKISKKKPK